LESFGYIKVGGANLGWEEWWKGNLLDLSLEKGARGLCNTMVGMGYSMEWKSEKRNIKFSVSKCMGERDVYTVRMGREMYCIYLSINLRPCKKELHSAEVGDMVMVRNH
jgi:hypothetical protein